MNKRKTAQRIAIYHAIGDLKHADLKEIITYIENQGLAVSVATIYRSIDALIETNYVKALTIGGKIIYETVKDNHYHFVCTECGTIIDVPADNEEIVVKVPQNIDLNIVNEFDLVMYGLCKECQKKKM